MNRTIRALSADKLQTLLDWAAIEGWNPGLADAPAFHAADPEGFLGAFVDGEMVAGISAVGYGDGFGFIGLYICRPDQRGRGHGKAVWDAGMGRLANRVIGLDAVPEQRDNYGRMGFTPAYGTVRMSGPIQNAELLPEVVAVTPALHEAVASFDARVFPGPRPAFLAAWLLPPRRSFAVMQGGRLRGYGVLRRCATGHKVGPLFAQSAEIAESLLRRLAAEAGGEIQIDIPAAQTEFIASLEALGFRPGFETTRMYRGPAPQAAAAEVYGITTLELG